eukprot:gnl/MRDRNA2_/MRDRNA2_63581_c0_seq1.p1 gnl/MRDRNA2_/MRDRNA2_63581_c0~~gnl/MRDRNA2_/MRDRNA2_63581_c0_seq1.p1  ORF type:complete len:195 (+),score=31.26 gnl/MRDRNA2_/MRDRNA2_63581_c0_seq1:38-622(+)
MSTSTLALDQLRGSSDASTFALDDPPEANNPRRKAWYLRSWFYSNASRVRVSLRFDPLTRRLASSKAIRVAVERRWAPTGTLDSQLQLRKMGGSYRTGLDEVFITEVVRAPCFASSTRSTVGDGKQAELLKGDGTIDLPAAVRVRVVQDKAAAAGCSLEVSAQPKDLDEGARPRVIVRRDFDSDGNLVATSVLH